MVMYTSKIYSVHSVPYLILVFFLTVDHFVENGSAFSFVENGKFV